MRTSVFNFALVLDRLASWTPPALYGLGGLLLAGKLLLPSAETPLLAVILPALGLALLAFLAALAWRQGDWYSAERAVAWLDLHNHAGGRMIAGDDAAIAGAAVRPGISPAHFGKRILLPCVFIVAAALAPPPERRDAVSSAGVEREMIAIERRIDLIENAEAAPATDIEEFRRQLCQLEDLAARNPEAAAEALAALPKAVDAAVARRLERGAEAVELAAGVYGELEKTVADGAAPGTDLENRMTAMYSALDAFVKNEGGLEALPPALREALEQAMAEGGAANLGEMASASGAQMDVERLATLLRAMAEAGDELRRAAEAVASAEGGGADGPAAERLRSLGDALDAMRLSGLAESGDIAGAGDVSRGPGDAPLIFGGETPAAGERFKPEFLPFSGDPVPGSLVRRDRAAMPEEDEPGEGGVAARSGAGVSGPVVSGEGTTILAPRRARAVEAYFKAL